MSATIHALPACSIERVFQLRNAARDSGTRYVPTSRNPKFIATSGVTDPFAHGSAERRFLPVDPTDPFDPNDGGRAA